MTVVQDKTENKVYLPILHDVGVALQDYILHARPSIPVPELFLTTKSIRGPIVDAIAIGDTKFIGRLVANTLRSNHGRTENAFETHLLGNRLRHNRALAK